MNDILLKRQEELKKEFSELEQERAKLVGRLQEIEPKMIQLQGAYNELVNLTKKESDDNKG